MGRILLFLVEFKKARRGLSRQASCDFVGFVLPSPLSPSYTGNQLDFLMLVYSASFVSNMHSLLTLLPSPINNGTDNNTISCVKQKALL